MSNMNLKVLTLAKDNVITFTEWLYWANHLVFHIDVNVKDPGNNPMLLIAKQVTVLKCPHCNGLIKPEN